MKNILLFLCVLIFPAFLFGQTINKTLIHDNLERDYKVYLPANYTGEEAMPLVFNFHGFGSNAFQQTFYADFRSIADTAGFIIVHPEGTLFQSAQHWNVGGFTTGSTIDDVGFTEAMIDTMADEYNIDLTRVYSTGMSNGGYMSFLLACQLSDKIAAIASVTGSMTPQTFDACDPQHPMPIMQIHGTADPTVPYGGGDFSKPIDEVMNYWVNFNNCNPEGMTTDLPDIDMSDGCTASHTIYTGPNGSLTNEHFKITDGRHTWPGNFLGGAGSNNDINASAEIWKFFSRYDINGLIPITGIEELDHSAISIYPNPTTSKIVVEQEEADFLGYELFSNLGKLVLNGSIDSDKMEINLDELSPSIYFLKIGNRTFKLIKVE